MTFVKFNELLGASTGIAGSVLIALNIDMEVMGFALYLISDGAWIYVGAKKKMTELLVMSSIFGIIGLVGIFNWM